jgi:hypothetical protein
MDLNRIWEKDIFDMWSNTFETVGEVFSKVGMHLLNCDLCSDPSLSALSKFEQAYFYLHTAAALNNKLARFYLAIFLENGLLPTTDVIFRANHKFRFL